MKARTSMFTWGRKVVSVSITDWASNVGIKQDDNLAYLTVVVTDGTKVERIVRLAMPVAVWDNGALAEAYIKALLAEEKEKHDETGNGNDTGQG